MEFNSLDKETREVLLVAQRVEITEHHIYERLARAVRDSSNREVLRRIADDELAHHNFWQKLTGRQVRPSGFKIFRFFWISKLLGLTFGIKLLERGEEKAQKTYQKVQHLIPEVQSIIKDEDDHEHELIGLLEEEKLEYVGSMVLGLNDALVELTGTLAGLSFALQNTRLIALAGLITGVAASFSMAASEYLSQKAESEQGRALKSSAYTGVAYIITVLLLILPYLFLANYLVCLGLTIAIAIVIILLFNYYVSVAKDYSFRKRFFEMAAISLGVALVTFGIGYLIRILLGVSV